MPAATLRSTLASAYTPWSDDRDAAVQSGPRFFGPAARPLFGWYHAPAGRVRDEAVVLCPSIGHEYVVGHRMVRALAERLGFALEGTLRGALPLGPVRADVAVYGLLL